MAGSGDDRFDGLYLNVTQQIRGVEPLLESVFSFLRRKTDFFTGAPDDKIEGIVLKVVRREMQLSKEAEAQKQRALKKAREEKARRAAAAEEARRRKDAAAAKEKKDKEEAEAQNLEEKAAPAATAAAAPAAATAGAADETIELGGDGAFDASSAPPAAAVAAAPAAPGKATATAGIEETKEAPATTVGEAAAAGAAATSAEGEEGEEEEAGKEPPPPGNGGTTDKYVWTQTLSEVTVIVAVPPGTKSRDVKVDITSRRVRVALKGAAEPLVDGELHQKVIVDDSCWTLEDGREVNILLQKDNKMEWWKCVVKGDPEIDTTKVVPENSKLDDLDSDTRKTVEKMMFDQRQKALGLPTSDELSKREILEKFMSSHPEMDFSKAKIS